MIMKTHGWDTSAAEAILEQLPDARPKSAVGNEIGRSGPSLSSSAPPSYANRYGLRRAIRMGGSD
jgi:hypothetical protein